ncbi:MAG: hypothetical protein K6C13_02580 [Oscillospiraceae bacterium]|nr:hypothetical protein [Oscillospiraceae bacterium]
MSVLNERPVVYDIIEFSRKHRWSKYFCAGAVTAIYGYDCLCSAVHTVGSKLPAAGKYVGEKAAAFSLRAFSGLIAASFAFMTIPVSVQAAENDTEESEDYNDYIGDFANHYLVPLLINLNDKTTLPEIKEDLPEVPVTYTVTVKGLPEQDKQYSVVFNYNEEDLQSDLVIKMIWGGDKALERFRGAFESYSIPADTLNIVPIEITMTDPDGNAVAFADDHSAEITVPLPESMDGHKNDLRAVRLDGKKISVLNTAYAESKDGSVLVKFSTDHFTSFALVSYADIPASADSEGCADGENEDVSSCAGEGAIGVVVDRTAGVPDIFMKKRRTVKAKRKRYRITKKLKSSELIF